MLGAPSGPSSTPAVAFGFPPTVHDEPKHRMLLALLSSVFTLRVGRPVVTIRSLDYHDLARNLESGAIQAAWLPPALFVELEKTAGLSAIAAADRGSGFGYFAAFFALIDSDITSIEQIPGHSVGWVDAASASGYVYPRLQLAAYGIDPVTAFQEEVFFRSHAAVVRAVVDRAVDVGATYVHLDPSNRRKVIRAGWRPPPADIDPGSIQWFEPFGPLPADVIAVRSDLARDIAKRLGQVFMTLDHESAEVRDAAMKQFGTTRFMTPNLRTYDVLRRAVEEAQNKGIEVSTSLRPG